MKLYINDRDKILILTPHPDDESIGCGGLLVKHAKQCDVILLTDGAKGNREWFEEKTRKVRKDEFRTAMQQLGVRKYEMWGIPDLSLNKYKYLLQNINLNGYKYVLVPNRNETHLDHKVIFKEIKKNISKNGIDTMILEYEVWTPMLKPTHHIDISDVITEKENLIQIYKCPLMHIDYDKRILALNYYRGIHYGCKFAECYNLTDCTLKLSKRIEQLFIRGTAIGGKQIGNFICNALLGKKGRGC